MVITFFSVRLDVFIKSPSPSTRVRESHFRTAESSGSRSDETKVQIRGCALVWLSQASLRRLQFRVCQRGDSGPSMSIDKVVFLAWAHTQWAQV